MPVDGSRGRCAHVSFPFARRSMDNISSRGGRTRRQFITELSILQCEARGLKHFAIEQDNAATWGDSLSGARVSYGNMKKVLSYARLRGSPERLDGKARLKGSPYNDSATARYSSIESRRALICRCASVPSKCRGQSDRRKRRVVIHDARSRDRAAHIDVLLFQIQAHTRVTPAENRITATEISDRELTDKGI
jgi:hypothetical protein